MIPKEEFDQIVRNTETVKRCITVGLFVLLALFCYSAFGATYGLEDRSGNKLILKDEPCPVSYLKGWKRAEFRYENRDLLACWMASQGVVYVIDDSGDLTPVPISAFTRMSEG